MLRNLLATTAIAALLTTAAYAQETTAPAAVNPAPMAQGKSVVPADGHLASSIIGKTVYNGTGNDAKNIGKVTDIVISPDGEVAAVVVGVAPAA